MVIPGSSVHVTLVATLALQGLQIFGRLVEPVPGLLRHDLEESGVDVGC
jgi:hypothetical protein